MNLIPLNDFVHVMGKLFDPDSFKKAAEKLVTASKSPSNTPWTALAHLEFLNNLQHITWRRFTSVPLWGNISRFTNPCQWVDRFMPAFHNDGLNFRPLQ